MSFKLIGAGALVMLAGTLAVFGQFAPDAKQAQLRAKVEAMLKSRERHIDSAELLEIMHNNQMQLAILDARDEADYNLFHLVDSRRLPADMLSAPWVKDLPTDSIKVVVSNDERRAEAAWTRLMMNGVPHAYILEGGINHWLDLHGAGRHPTTLPARAAVAPGDDTLRHEFSIALGDRAPGANPDVAHLPQLPFQHKVHPPKPISKMAGGCGG